MEQKVIRKYEKAQESHAIVNRAIKKGLLKKLPCMDCGSEKSIAHHKNYNDPLSVEWLCRNCHGKEHRANGWHLYDKKSKTKDLTWSKFKKTNKKSRKCTHCSGTGKIKLEARLDDFFEWYKCQTKLFDGSKDGRLKKKK